MLKKDAIGIFGTVTATAAALDISHSAVSQWPEKLTLGQADRVRGAAVRLKKRLPRHIRRGDPNAQPQEPQAADKAG